MIRLFYSQLLAVSLTIGVFFVTLYFVDLSTASFLNGILTAIMMIITVLTTKGSFKSQLSAMVSIPFSVLWLQGLTRVMLSEGSTLNAIGVVFSIVLLAITLSMGISAANDFCSWNNLSKRRTARLIYAASVVLTNVLTTMAQLS